MMLGIIRRKVATAASILKQTVQGTQAASARRCATKAKESLLIGRGSSNSQWSSTLARTFVPFQAGAPMSMWTRFYSSGNGDLADAVVPFMGESITDGTLAKFLKRPGDCVEVDETTAQIETDKVTIDVNSPESGIVQKLVAKEGDVVQPGTKVAVISKSGETHVAPSEKISSKAAPEPSHVEKQKVAEESPKAKPSPPKEKPKAPSSPSSVTVGQICLSSPPSTPPPSSSSSHPSPPKWSCKACTFLNPYKNSDCEVCGTRCPVLSLSSFEDLSDTHCDGDLDSSVGSVFLPLRPCKRKTRDSVQIDDDCAELGKFRDVKASNKAINVTEDNDPAKAIISSLKILSYNVWFREHLEMHKRMQAIDDIIQLHSPEFICFQEVTPNIYDIFKQSSWWKAYSCSVSVEKAYSRRYYCMLSKLPVKSFSNKPFGNSIMGRELCIAEVEAARGKPLVVATSHLESPCPAPPKWDQMYSKERVKQANEALSLLKKNPNVIFGGDMNWDDKLDGQFPLQEGWIDAWSQLRPKESGWTYDTNSNQMLTGNRTLQKRLDRFICNFRDFKISRIDMMGMDAIPGVLYTKEKKVRKETKHLVLPVLPSDHYGLLLTISGQ